MLKGIANVARQARGSLTAGLVLALALAVAAYAVAAGIAPRLAHAQDEAWGTSYITPFPEGDTYRVQVIGDFMADSLMTALTESLSDDARVQMSRRSRSMAGLIRVEQEEFVAFEQAIGSEPPHVAVVMVGIGDRIPLRGPNNRRVAVGSDEWKAEYARRVDRLIRTLKRHGAAIYWVSLPIVRRPDMSEDVQMLNEIFRERSLIGNVKFINIYEAFSDEEGRYNQYGPDLTGKTRILREGDGVSFTPAGNRKLAHFVEREIKRDITQARNERTIPLAGAEVEQKRIAPKPKQAEAAPESGWGTAILPALKGREARPKASGSSTAYAGSAPAGTGELKADTSKVAIKVPGRIGREETINVEIVRPAIPSSVLALVTRRASPDRATHLGDSVSDTLSGGAQLLNSITPGMSVGSQAQRQRLAPTQSAFFRVLVKGERLSPKPGRADDFRWPRPDVEPPPAASERPVPERPVQERPVQERFGPVRMPVPKG